MSKSTTFVEKVLALRPDFAGANEKEKNAVSSLRNDAANLAQDVKVSYPF